MSSSSDEEEVFKLKAAIDPSFALEPQYTNGTINTVPQSNRPKESKVWESGHTYETIQIGPEAKCFLAKRLSEALDKQIKMVKPKTKGSDVNIEENENSAGVYLFSNSPFKFTSADFKNSEIPDPPCKKRKKSKIERRKIKESEDEESDDETTKLKSVAVSADWVLNTKY